MFSNKLRTKKCVFYHQLHYVHYISLYITIACAFGWFIKRFFLELMFMCMEEAGASLLGGCGGVSHPPKILKNRGNSGKIRGNSGKIMENSVTSGNICGC